MKYVFTLLGVLFVGLKLTDHITWSWWWVTAPFWGPLLLVLVGVLCAAWAATRAHARRMAYIHGGVCR